VLRESQCHVVVASTSRRMLAQLLKEVGMLEEFFPGLRRLAALFPCYSCRMKRQRFMEGLTQKAVDLNASALESGVCDHIDIAHTADTLFEAGKDELEQAENNDIEAYKYITPIVLGNADDPRYL
jgi:hypothetical protein